MKTAKMMLLEILAPYGMLSTESSAQYIIEATSPEPSSYITE